MSGERGSVTIWGIGLVALLFAFAGLAVDTWRVFTERQALAGLADSAAIAGANGIDEDEFRAYGLVVLDRPEASACSPPGTWRPASAPPGAQIGFRDAGIEVTLIRHRRSHAAPFFLGGEPVDLRVTAFANPAQREAAP